MPGPNKYVPVFVFLWVKRSGHEYVHSSLPDADIKNKWGYCTPKCGVH